ncbi:MAG: alpha/beta fold hydrolase [Sphaerochaetaceae bacterium]|nr:alpha/beta fold hydrolase [Sphaerochaetaceae bacterium]
MGLVSMVYKKMFVKRYDDNHITHYFSYQDFPGLQAKPISFMTPQGLKVKGNIYSYEGSNTNDLVIFCHGIGGGHRSYMREIELVARNGYEVLSYDNIGCFESEGSSIRGMTESLNDLDSCLTFIQSDSELCKRRISLIGHSWGGYAVGNILSFYKNIYSVGIISTFDSLDAVFGLGFGGKMKMFKKGIIAYEKKMNPKYIDCSISKALENTTAKVVMIHSKDDSMINIDAGLGYVQARVQNPNVRFVTVDGKHHNPNYTEDAVNYMNATFGEFNKLVKEKALKTFEEKREYMNKVDWVRMTEQDPVVWKELLENLK